MSDSVNIFNEAFKTIVNDFGVDVILDVRKLNALLMDYAPSLIRERKLIISALDDGIGKDLIGALSEDESQKQLCVNRSVKSLVKDLWITEDAARLAVSSIAFVIGMADDIRKYSGNGTSESDGSFSSNNEWSSSSTSAYNSEKELIKGTEDFTGKDINSLLRNYSSIGYKAFSANEHIKDIKIPDSIKFIKPKAFINCANLVKISIPSSVTAIGEGVFEGCTALNSIIVDNNKNYTVVNGLLIDKQAKNIIFASRGINNICVIPPMIAGINRKAFEKSPVQEVKIPAGLTHIDNKAFYCCDKLEKFEVNMSNRQFSAIDGVLHNRQRTTLIRFPFNYKSSNYIFEDSVTNVGDYAFSRVSKLQSITFTSSLKSIGARAFEYCNNISSIVLPNSVEVIGQRAFQYCSGIENLMLPRSIQEIDDFAFFNCSSISMLSIPKFVTRIGHAAFKNCTKLSKIVVQENINFIGDGAFEGCSSNLEVVVRNNSYVENYCKAHQIAWSNL